MQHINANHYEIDKLSIDPSIISHLKNKNIEFIEQITALTINNLMEITDLTEETCKQIFFKADFFLDQMIYPRPLCSNLPFKFDNLSIDFLDLPLNAYKRLNEASIHSLGQLANMTFKEINALPNMSNILTLEIEFILSKFVDNYRNGNIAIQAIVEIEGLLDNATLPISKKIEPIPTAEVEKEAMEFFAEEEDIPSEEVEKEVIDFFTEEEEPVQIEESKDETIDFFAEEEEPVQIEEPQDETVDPVTQEDESTDYLEDEDDEKSDGSFLASLAEMTDYQIDETGKILGIKVGVTNKKEVAEKMGEPDRLKEDVFYYDDLGIAIYFNEGDIIEEVIITAPYWGKTTKGIGIGDSMEKVYEVYGLPKMYTDNIIVWQKLSISSDSDYNVREIRLSIQ